MDWQDSDLLSLTEKEVARVSSNTLARAFTLNPKGSHGSDSSIASSLWI